MKTVYISEPPPLSEAQRAELAALEGREPDTSDIPEAPAENWAYARRLHSPENAVSLRIDPDVLDWLKRKDERYQVEINRILRQAVDADPTR